MSWSDRPGTVSAKGTRLSEMVAWVESPEWVLSQGSVASPQPLNICTITVSTSQMSKLRFGGKCRHLPQIS